MKLEPYNAEIRLTNLTLGIDNIHYDVFLSPRFVEFTRKYLGDLVRQAVNINLPFGKDKDRKQSGSPEHGAFRKMLTDILQESVTRAKFQQSVETDVLHHLALLKFISQETGNQFSSILVEGKDWIRGRGELFEHSEQAHVMRSKIADLQADRKNVKMCIRDRSRGQSAIFTMPRCTSAGEISATACAWRIATSLDRWANPSTK